MRCQYCQAEKEMLHVIDSRTCEGGRAIRRRRVCKACNKRFTTYERIEQPNRLMVVKKDGRRVPWDRDREVLSTIVGELVMEKLRRVDQVAYVRFASVYRQFKTVEELVDEARAVIDAHRYDVPGQGRLFMEVAQREPASASNGHNADAPEKPARPRGRKPKAQVPATAAQHEEAE